MAASFGSIAGWILAVLLTLASLERSEAQFWIDPPRNPFIVVEDGVNNTEVDLVWTFSNQIAPEDKVLSVTIVRERQGTEETIATRSGGGATTPTDFRVPTNLQSKYNPREPATLQLLNVKDGEEYLYTVTVLYQNAQATVVRKAHSVFVDVKVPPKITTPPVSNVRRGRGSNVTLTCDVSGDPLPNITWTREGATTNQLKNATGPILHLVRIQLDDAGSYRCTADNGYGVVTSLASVNIICTSQCNLTKVAIRITNGAVWSSDLTNRNSRYYKELVSNLTAAVSSPFSQPENAGKRPYGIFVTGFSSGSVRAFLDLEFPSTLSDALKPLREAVESGTLGQFRVNGYLEVDPTTGPPSSTTDPTKNTQKEPSVGARSGLSPEAMWGIIGACIAIVVVVVVIIVVCCICGRGRCCACRKGSGASKGKYTEADGYRMNKQPPSSGLGTASPAYVEARMYAPPNATKKQDDQPPPLNYSELSFEKSDKQPPPRYNPEYADVTPEKRPPPSGGQQGEGGFELWC